jgi:hypothetical protein
MQAIFTAVVVVSISVQIIGHMWNLGLENLVHISEAFIIVVIWYLQCKDGDSKAIWNISNTAYIYVVPSPKNRIPTLEVIHHENLTSMND